MLNQELRHWLMQRLRQLIEKQMQVWADVAAVETAWHTHNFNNFGNTAQSQSSEKQHRRYIVFEFQIR